jgi:hypothetical protein
MIHVNMMELALGPFMRPSDIFLQPISIVKPTRCTISQIYFILEQHSVSDSPFVHHQESKTVHTASGVYHTGSVAAC